MKHNLILLIILILINAIARYYRDFATWYAKTISPLFVNTIGRFFDLFSFTVFEWVVIFLIIGLLYLIFKVHSLTYIIRYLLIILLVFTLTTGINYQRASISEDLDLEILTYDDDDLDSLCLDIIDKFNSLSFDELSIEQINDEVKTSIQSIMPGYYPDPKPMFFSSLMTMCGLSGIFSPFTIEASYNKDMPLYQIPFTMAHELSHLKSYMSEDEANFLAYLTCIRSSNTYLQYSGYLTAFVYVVNALYRDGYDVSGYYQQLSDQAYEDLQENHSFWHQYDQSLANMTDVINDTYLKMNTVEDGVQSYSMVVSFIYSYSQKNKDVS